MRNTLRTTIAIRHSISLPTDQVRWRCTGDSFRRGRVIKYARKFRKTRVIVARVFLKLWLFAGESSTSKELFRRTGLDGRAIVNNKKKKQFI